LFNEIKLNGASFGADELNGPYVANCSGELFTAAIDSQWRICEMGAAACVVSNQGRHINADGKSFFDFFVKLTLYAGAAYVKLDYQLINREKTEKETLQSSGLSFRPAGISGEVKTVIGESNYRTKYTRGDVATPIRALVDADYIMNTAFEHIPETFLGSFFCDWRDNSRGLAVDIYQAYQNFPKAFELNSEGMRAWIVPPEQGALPEHQGVEFIRGVARTTRMMLYFHDGTADLEELNARALQFEMPDVPCIEKKYYSQTAVCEDMSAPMTMPAVERYLIQRADSRSRGLGMLNFGDAPDPGYTGQGRGHGRLVWENNEYDVPHALFLLYARHGERRFLDAVVAAAEHWVDVDIVHASDDPLRIGGHIEHSADHATGTITPSHQWVEGLLDYYHLTNDRAGFDCAISIGENILQALALPKFQTPGAFSVRETGWALRALTALYNETFEQRWLDCCEAIIDQYMDWRNTLGGLSATYTDHAQIRVVFMIAVGVSSMMRYYRLRPSERLKEMMLFCVDDLIANAMVEGTNLFYYKELPSLRRLGGNTIVLEALAYAYELTGDVKYIEAGLGTFYTNLEAGSSGRGGGKVKHDKDTVVMPGITPKAFAQPF
jgi:hypothetical protein